MVHSINFVIPGRLSNLIALNNYAKYTGYLSSLTSTNLSILYDLEGEMEVTFMWMVTEVDGEQIVLDVYLNVSINVSGGGERILYSRSATMYVDSESYDVYDEQNTYIGKFLFIGPVYAEEGDKINWKLVKRVIFDNIWISGSVEGSVIRVSHTDTLLGLQKSYSVDWVWTLTINFSSTRRDEFVESSLYLYDYDTGVAIRVDISDFIFRYLGIFEWGTPLYLSETNIDIGPPDIYYMYLRELMETLPLLLPPVIFTTLLLIIYFLRRRRRSVRIYVDNQGI